MNGQVINYRVEGAKYGISFGTALAIAISYTNNHSVLWAIIHGFFSWLYDDLLRAAQVARGGMSSLRQLNATG